MTRKTFLGSSLLLGTSAGREMIAAGLDSLGLRRDSVAQAETPGRLLLQNDNHKLEFDSVTGQFAGFEAAQAPDQQFILAASDDPVFVIQYLDNHNEYQQVDSTRTQSVKVHKENSTVTAVYRQLGGLNLDVTVAIRMPSGERFSYWSIALSNRAGIRITDMQFPVVVVPYALGGDHRTEHLLQPYAAGRLLKNPVPQNLEPDSPHAWQLNPESGDSAHYPGGTVAQFLAYWNDRAGIYISCQDAAGALKLIKPLHHKEGIRLGVSHIGDWPSHGERKLEYDVALTAFQGDWYEAASIYRDWSLQQRWAQTPLHRRTNIPAWLLDSPPHIIVRIQGQLDTGPADPNPEFLPYPKTMPLLQAVSEHIQSPVVAVIMSWERPGPWIYPDCFPPAGGAPSLREFTRLARAKGWHVGTFCNGTRWVIGHFWSGYDGRKYFEQNQGARTVCRTAKQQLWAEAWDQTWRPSYACCLAVKQTRSIAVEFVRTLLSMGLDWIQFLDQNIGCATFPCFAADHGHPAIPGKWMTAAMRNLLDAFHAEAAALKSKEGRELVLSVEQAPNEVFMSDFQVCDVRAVPVGHTGPPGSSAGIRDFVPLYHFLYHEFIVIQGGFGFGPEPYHMQIRSAYNLVVGEIPGAVLKGDGRLLNKDTSNWAPWEPQIGSNQASLDMLRTATALRRGAGKPYLVYGRMQRPAVVNAIKTMEWENNGQVHKIPAVFHSAWQSPEGRFAILAANWTSESQDIEFTHHRLQADCTQTISSLDVQSSHQQVNENSIRLTIPAMSCALMES